MSDETPPAAAPAKDEDPTPAWQTALVWLLLLGFLGAMAFAVGMFALPPLVHAMDSGKATADAGELSVAWTGTSRNLSVKGRALMEKAVKRQVSRRGSVGRTTVFFPIVTPAWKPDQPVKLIGAAEEITEDQGFALAGSETFEGVLRNAPLETYVFGLRDSVREFLETKENVKVAPDAVLLSVTPPPPKTK